MIIDQNKYFTTEAIWKITRIKGNEATENCIKVTYTAVEVI